MEEWKEYRLGDCVEMQKGFAFKSSDYIKHGIKIIKVSNLNQKRFDDDSCVFISPILAEQYSIYSLVEDDIVISTVGSWPTNPESVVGKVCRVPIDINGSLLNQNAVRLRAKNNFNQKFLYYILLGSNFSSFIANTAQGSANQASITLEDIRSFKFISPSIKGQEEIVSILKSLDDKIEVNRRINEQLEELAQALFKSWFVDFEPFKDGEFVESELGMIPKGWKVGKLGDYCKVKSGYAFKSSWWQDKGLKVIKIKNITSNGELDMNECSYVAPENTLKAKDFKTEVGDMLIAMTGATIGKFCMVCSNETMYVNQRVGKFFLGSNPIIRLPFIYCTLKTDRVYSEIVNKGQGSAQPNISGSDIENIRIPIPTNTDYLLLFNEKLKSVFERMINNQQEITLLTTLRDTLLPKLMSGDIAIE